MSGARSLRGGCSGGPNWYAYVNNDPVNWRDPWGLLPASDVEAVGLLYAYAAGRNAAHSYRAADFLPGSSRTDAFGDPQGPYNVGDGPGRQVQWYETTHHAGEDRAYSPGASPSPIVAPAYLTVAETSGSRITFNVVGTERNVSIMHLNPDDVSAVSRGQVFAPGDVIASFPRQSYGTATGDPHVHVQESNAVDGVRVIVDPDTHQPVAETTYEWRRGFSANQSGQIQWGAWNPSPAY